LKRVINIFIFYFACHAATAQQYVHGILMSGASTEEAHPGSTINKLALYDEIDASVIEINAGVLTDYTQLVAVIARKHKDDLSIVRSIYTWIATNISYDQRAYHDRIAIGCQNAPDVWQNRLAVCEGYANLFNAMCASAGIESRLIKGYARDIAGQQFNFPNHAWNSVLIGGKWYLVDVTWASVNNASNSVLSKDLNDKYAKRKLDYFFMINPSDMILTHLPEDPFWQLQNKYIDLATFRSGEEFVKNALANAFDQNLNFEKLISDHEALDSLDRAIAYLERMEANENNGVKEYGLGIGYYYKAQEILKKANRKNTNLYQSAKNKALLYYQKSLEHLSQLDEEDFGYDISKDLAENVSLRMEILQ
jgi:exonuclease VII small subunit